MNWCRGFFWMMLLLAAISLIFAEIVWVLGVGPDETRHQRSLVLYAASINYAILALLFLLAESLL